MEGERWSSSLSVKTNHPKFGRVLASQSKLSKRSLRQSGLKGDGGLKDDGGNSVLLIYCRDIGFPWLLHEDAGTLRGWRGNKEFTHL
jgi:hypothetical protein